MKLTIINAADVRALLPMRACIGLMRRALAAAPTDGALQPIRTGLGTPDRRGGMGLMPGFVAHPPTLGVKVVTVFPGNHGGPLGSHQGMALIFNAATGAPRAVIEARALTAVRTAAATAVATDVLARADSSILAVFGLGDQAAAHLEALPMVREFARVIVWGRDVAKAAAFAAAQSERFGRAVEAIGSAQEAAGLADVLCTVTAAAEPILAGAWLRPGQHLNAVGSSIPTTSEIDVEAVVRARYFVDFEPSARALAGDFQRALAAGAVGADHMLGAVGEVITGGLTGRTGPRDITLFKSLGMVAEDLIAADFVLREARERGVGQVVDW
ncbi:MAG TPA: ornithine cyclodeaminase family protein [Caulobacteraceae bacterium]